MSVMSGSRRLFLAARIAFALFAGLTGVCQAQPIPFIDTHVHFDGHPPENFSGAAADAIRWMDRLGIRMVQVMPPPEAPIRVRRYDVESFAFLRERYPNRFAPLGGPGKLKLMIFQIPAGSVGETQRREFSAEAARIIAQGAVGFGEIGIHHFAVPAMGERHQFTQAPGDHPLLLLLEDIAAEYDVPIDVHFDAVPEDMDLPQPLRSPPNPSRLKQNLPAFERFVAHNRNARIVWGLCRGRARPDAHRRADPRVVRSPSNLYMSLRFPRGLNHPTFTLSADGKLKPFWLKLLRDFPDRFVLGSDAFYTDDSGRRRGVTEEGLANFQTFLAQLPRPLADKIAVENVKSIYPRAFAPAR